MSLTYFSFQDPHLISRIRQVLSSELPVCVVQDMPCEAESNQTLEAFAQQLGEPLCEPHNLKAGMVCRVEVELQQERPYANTPWYFPGHTDCADHAEAPDTVLLLCEQPSVEGGESFVTSLSAILDGLKPADLKALGSAQFYFRYGYLPILSTGYWQGHSIPVIRYNRLLLEYAQPESDNSQQALLDRLDALIYQQRVEFKLQAGECLVLNNLTCVHGRAAFDEQGQRLLKRVRLNLATN